MSSRNLGAYGPSVAVLVTVAAVLLAGPMAVRQLTYARTQASIIQASDRLRTDNVLEQINQAHRDIAAKVEPSVVYISTYRKDSESRLMLRTGPQVQLSSGSGWVFDEDGHIVTNAHVIEEAQRIQVQLHDGTLRDAEVVGTDLRTDIAVLRIAPGGLHPAERADSTTVRQGDRIFAFGSPFDFRFSMSQGIVSGIGRDAQLETLHYQNFIQVDAAINPGNSGGPLTNIYGQVIGMNTAIATGRRESTTSQGSFAGIGLAIPMTMIESVVPQLISKGEVSRGFIGVQLQPAISQPTLARGFQGEGVEILSVNEGGPAANAGLRPGDVILTVDGGRVATLAQLRSMVSSRSPGDTISLDVWRYEEEAKQGVRRTVGVTLAELRPEQMVQPALLRFLRTLGLVQLSTSTPERARQLNVPFRRGVIVEQILAGRPVDTVIDPGTIITHVFDEPVNNIDEFYARMERYFFSSPRGVVVRLVTPDGREDAINLRP